MPERDPVVDGGAGNRIKLQAGDTVAKLRRSLFADATNYTSTGSPDTVTSNSIAAGTMYSDLGRIVAHWYGDSASNENEKNWGLTWGGSSLCTFVYELNINDWELVTTIIREANTSIKTFSKLIVNGQTVKTKYTRLTSLNLGSVAYNLNFSFETPAGAGDLVYRFSHGEYIPAP